MGGREEGGERRRGRKVRNIPCNSLAVAMNLPCATSHSNASKLDAVLVDQSFTQCLVTREEKRREKRREGKKEERREVKRRGARAREKETEGEKEERETEKRETKKREERHEKRREKREREERERRRERERERCRFKSPLERKFRDASESTSQERE